MLKPQLDQFAQLRINNEDLLLIAGDSHKTGQSNKPMITHYEALQQFTEKNFSLMKFYIAGRHKIWLH